MNVKLSIIIPCYENPVGLERLLDSLAINESEGLEVIVVDDGSNTKLDHIVYKYNFQYYWTINAGPAAARNYGSKLANGKAILFLDSDTVMMADTMIRIRQIIENKDFEIVSIPYHPQSISNSYASRFKGLFDAYNVWYKIAEGPINVLNGSSCLFNKNIFAELGGWSAKFTKPDVENEEFSCRINKKYEIFHYPDLFVKHEFPNFRDLIIKIYFRTESWTCMKLNNKVSFDGLTRTKYKAIISLIPLFTIITLILMYFYPLFLIIAVIMFLVFLIGNIGFFKFLYSYSNTYEMLIFSSIHFIFCLAVSLGAFKGLLSIFKYTKNSSY